MSTHKLISALVLLGHAVAAGLLLVAGSPGWTYGVLGATAGVTAGGAWWLIDTRMSRPAGTMREMILAMKRDGDLSQRVPAGNAEVGSAAAAFNELIASFQSIVGKIYFNAEQVACAATQVSRAADSVSDATGAQRSAAQETATVVEQINAGISGIAGQAGQTAERARRSQELSENGEHIANRAAAEIERIAQSVEASAAAITQLGERSRSIGGIVKVIREIADQTNLLALNAAIEAAHAGEQGRGFAVVADEVRKLAERTSSATAEISGVIASIRTDTESAVQSARAGAEHARSGAGLAREAAEALSEINLGAVQTLDMTSEIARAINEQSQGGQRIVTQVHNILESAERNDSGAGQALDHARQLDYLSVNLKEIGTVFKFGDAGKQALEIHGGMPTVVQQAARDIGQVLERLLAGGRISEADLFDENYQAIPNTRPQKYHTKFDRLTDETFPAVQEPLLRRSAHLVYAGAVDRKGYFPTHNTRFSKPLTGDEKVDIANNRTKRIFDDPIGKRCGSHALPFLIQTYRRDTGELMHDISAPIRVRGRQWGGFRIGYLA